MITAQVILLQCLQDHMQIPGVVFSTNEPAINYTAPVAYVAGAIEAIRAGANYTPPVTEPPEITSTTKGSAKISVRVYPNPSKETIYCDFESKGSANIHITDQTGKVVLTKSATGKNEQLNISELPQGLYIVTISTEEGVAIQKLVKE